MLPIRIYRNRIIYNAKHTGLAQAGSASTITLAASAPGDYLGHRVRLESGAGSGQMRTIKAYDSVTKVATVDPDWTTAPIATDQYRVI